MGHFRVGYVTTWPLFGGDTVTGGRLLACEDTDILENGETWRRHISVTYGRNLIFAKVMVIFLYTF